MTARTRTGLPGVRDALGSIGVVPVLMLDDPRDAPAVADALVAGGLPCVEVTFRTEGALEAIRRMAAGGADLLVGAGTVVSTGQVDEAVAAGARFVVSPGIDEKIVDYCQDCGVTVLPGAATASEILLALRCGLKAVKFFPAEPLGGLRMLEALAAPFPGMAFIPTGGIGPGHLEAYLAHPAVPAVGGSWMVARGLVRERRFSEITRLAAEAVAAVRRVRRGTPS